MPDSAPVSPALTVLIVSYNTRELLDRCLETLFASVDALAGIAVEVIVVDNGSTDGSVELLATRYPTITVLRNAANRGFAGANNRGLALVRTPMVLLLNSDAFVTAAALSRSVDLLRTEPRVGMVGVRLTNPDGTVQAEGGCFPTLWADFAVSVGLNQVVGRMAGRRSRVAATRIGPADWVQGAYMLVRTAALREVGLLDEVFFMYSEEVDWCRRFWSHGWEVWYAGDVSVVHVGGASAGENDFGRRQALYRSRLGLRRRLSGPGSSATLWLGMLVGLGARVLVRAVTARVTRRRHGRHSSTADWRLLRAVARMDPLARWAAC